MCELNKNVEDFLPNSRICFYVWSDCFNKNEAKATVHLVNIFTSEIIMYAFYTVFEYQSCFIKISRYNIISLSSCNDIMMVNI